MRNVALVANAFDLIVSLFHIFGSCVYTEDEVTMGDAPNMKIVDIRYTSHSTNGVVDFIPLHSRRHFFKQHGQATLNRAQRRITHQNGKDESANRVGYLPRWLPPNYQPSQKNDYRLCKIRQYVEVCSVQVYIPCGFLVLLGYKLINVLNF